VLIKSVRIFTCYFCQRRPYTVAFVLRTALSSGILYVAGCELSLIIKEF
jgi:hypothetical protein